MFICLRCFRCYHHFRGGGGGGGGVRAHMQNRSWSKPVDEFFFHSCSVFHAKQGGLVCGKLLKTTKNDDAPSKATFGCVLFLSSQGLPQPTTNIY